jgi:[acyl-carrier-protein] S-malonyltransferase
MQEADDIKQKLIEQIYSPVLWEDSVRKLLELGVDTFVEIGPGNVLTGLVRKVDRSVKTYIVSEKESVMKFVDEYKMEAI